MEGLLRSKGFVPVAQIDIDGTRKFIKVYDLNGETAYVEKDTERGEGVSPADLSYREVKESSLKAPEETKISRAECMQLNVCGLAYECDGEMCTLVRDPTTLDLDEHHFAIQSRTERRQGIEKGEPVAFPIVRLSEIIANERAVMRNITATAQRIRGKALYDIKREWMAVRLVADKMSATTAETLTMLNQAQGKVFSVSSTLHEKRQAFSVPITAQFHEAYVDTVKKLHLCNDRFAELVVMTRDLSDIKTEMEGLTVRLMALQSKLQAKY